VTSSTDFSLCGFPKSWQDQTTQAEACATWTRASTGRIEKDSLFERKPAHDDRRKHVIPLRGNVLVWDLNVSLLAGKKGWRCRKKQSLLIAQDHLAEGVMEFNRDFNLVNLTVAAVLNRAENVRHFLIEEICRPAHLGLEKMNLRRVG